MRSCQYSNMIKKNFRIFLFFGFLVTEICSVNQYPKGYYPFEESPAKNPPKVRKPPYLQTQVACPGLNDLNGSEQTLDNLCGDLNKGYLPLNPIGQNVDGSSYPFELFKAKTLDFFSKTLPILKADDTLPKVARYDEERNEVGQKNKDRILFYHHRVSRSLTDQLNEEVTDLFKKDVEARQSKSGGFCKESYGVFCMLYNVLSGNKEKASDRIGGEIDAGLVPINSLDSPMTPCPSAVEYVTPVFAKNYQGVWRYVVQIPYEGYFTQTVEVVKCLSSKCEYLDGSCLASPRWVSLLVAEIFYPDASFPSLKTSFSRNPVTNVKVPPEEKSGQKHYQKRNTAEITEKCDGMDDFGCYQVRLYYDWFLIPGSCKCWKNDFFDQIQKK